MFICHVSETYQCQNKNHTDEAVSSPRETHTQCAVAVAVAVHPLSSALHTGAVISAQAILTAVAIFYEITYYVLSETNRNTLCCMIE